MYRLHNLKTPLPQELNKKNNQINIYQSKLTTSLLYPPVRSSFLPYPFLQISYFIYYSIPDNPQPLYSKSSQYFKSPCQLFLFTLKLSCLPLTHKNQQQFWFTHIHKLSVNSTGLGVYTIYLLALKFFNHFAVLTSIYVIYFFCVYSER